MLAYYHWEPARTAMNRLAELRSRTGFAFSIASTAVFGGLVPFLYLLWRGEGEAGRARYRWPQGLGLTAFWAYKGFEIDLFYRILAHAIGTGHDAATIAKKAAIDQFLYCPSFAVPATVAIYEWVGARGGLAEFAADWRTPGWYRRRVLPVLISNLAVWIPAVAIIYSLPTPLQLPLQNLVLCFFTLLVSHQTRRGSAPAPSASPPLPRP